MWRRVVDNLHHHWAVPVAFMAGLTATVIVADGVAKAMAETDTVRFATVCDRVVRDLGARVEGYVAIVRAGGMLLALDPDMDASVFRRFVHQVELGAKYPGVDGIGFSRRTADRGGERHQILFVEPSDERNRAAVGTDMSLEPTRRAAMDLARDTGGAVATAPLILAHPSKESPPSGFLVFFPVYHGPLPDGVAERRARLLGFVYARFRAADLFPGTWGTGTHPIVTFDVFDEGTSPASLLYSTPSATGEPGYSGQRHLDLYGRRWSVRLHSTANFDEPTSRNLVPAIVTAGVGLTLLLTSFIGMQTRARRRGEKSEARIEQLLASERGLRAEAERVSHVKDEFLATLSHELRTPLNAIVGWTQLMSTPGASDETRRKAVAIVQRNAQVQTQLIDDLLDMSRIVSGKLRLSMAIVDPVVVVEEAINVVRPTAAAKGIVLETAIDPEAPPVRADAARLQQALWNLLNNSMKFTPPGGRVHVTLRASPSQIDIVVADTGAGIPAELLPYVFERFKQGDGSTTRQHGGLGLGLSIVKSLIEMHGGTIRASSDGPGKGSSFALTLPASGSLEARQQAVGPDTADTQSTLQGIRVLVVEDDPDAAAMVAAMLENHGARLTVCASAREALEKVERGVPVDVIVSDLGMPGLDGFEFMRRLRSMPGVVGALPAIALSAYASDDDRRRSRDAGYQFHLSKPYHGEELVAACLRALRQFPV